MGTGSDDDSDSFVDKQCSRKQWIEKQNIQIRNAPEKSHVYRACTPEVRRQTPDCHRNELGGSCRDLLRVPCALSLSTLTGLSVGSRVVRPCHAIKTSLGASSTRRTPSTLLLHGYDWVSPEDQRILSMMVSRRQAQMEEQEMFLSARQLWEKDKLLYNQMVNEKRKQWNDLVLERRKIDQIEKERRREAAELSFNQHIADLEKSIDERHKRCEVRHQQIVLQKRQSRGDTDADTELHRLRRQQLMMQVEARSSEHIQQMLAKESKADHNLAAIIDCRERNINIRKERESRMVAAQQVREALSERLEEWCQQNREQLSSRMCLSECRHEGMVQWRRKMAQDNNAVKSANHAYAMSMLNEEERIKEHQIRQELAKKELRLQSVQMRRENDIMRSRQHALTTSALRQQIKAAYPLIN